MKLKKRTIRVTKDRYPSEVNCYEVLSHEETNDTRYVLRPSPMDRQWSAGYMGTEIIRFMDDGNGVDISFDKKGELRLNYSEIYDLFLLLGEYFDRYGTQVETISPRGKKRR